MRVMALSRRVSCVALVALCAAAVHSAEAQGRGAGKNKMPPGQAKKVVTAGAAVVVTREVLVKHGYTVVRIEDVGLTHVIYYRRGNMGRGRGLGPIERMVVRPSGDIVVFEAGPAPVLLDIRVRLGL